MGFLRQIIYNFKMMKKADKLKALSNEELLALSDEELYNALEIICYFAVYDINDADLTNEQRVCSTLLNLDSEVNNGGLCQFFVNSSRALAPFVSESLSVIKADKTKELFDSFISENKIDLKDLNSFIIKDLSEFAEQNNRYPFDDFDNKYYEIGEVNDLMIRYARENINAIINR